MRSLRTSGIAAAVALLLAACGGGGADTSTRVSITSVKVFGDSLADSGTFGYKFTVQSAGSLIFPERVAQAYGVSLCNFFAFTGSTFAPKPGCTNYAIGGGRINNASSPASPQSIVVQLQTAAATTTFGASDLVVVDGGGNDAADLVGAYLAASRDGGARYLALLGTLLDPTTIGQTLAQPNGRALVGGLYMTALAGKFQAAIQTNTLDRGAQRVAVLNMPGITNTPRFQLVLDSIAASQGAAGRAAAESLFRGWIQAYNAALASKFAGNSKVIIVDFFTSFDDQVQHPAQFSLTNVKNPACPVTGVGSDGLPVYDFPTCTDAALAANPPAGAAAGWWQSYAFSDGFHPTPYGHRLLGQLLSKSLATAGWL